MIINHNLMAMNTHRQLGVTASAQSKSMEKLSSGLRVNRAADDAAGLSISEKMRAQIKGLNQASRNAQDGISLIQTAEGALNETHAILQRMRELSVQAANGTYDTADKTNIKGEMDQLVLEVGNIATTTKFNGISLLDNTAAITLQIGANTETLVVNAVDTKAATLTVGGLDVSVAGGASTAIAAIDVAIDKVSTSRSTLGAKQNRLEHIIRNVDTTAENLQASESRIRDVDMAKEMMDFTKNNILSQAAQAMLAQANQAPQGVLQLLR